MSRAPRRIGSAAVPVALPDNASLTRLSAIQGALTRPLRNGNGGIRGIANGDPTISVTGAVEGNQQVARSQGAIGRKADSQTPAMIQDVAMSDPNLAPYNSLLLQRMRAGL